MIRFLLFLAGVAAFAQTPATYRVETGTRIPLSMVNSISTAQSQPGDTIYLQTAFPIVSSGRIVIPAGSYVTGTVTEVKRAGKVKGRSELHLRFDTLMLPNGTTRTFGATLAGLDAAVRGKLDREESGIEGPGNKASDVSTVTGNAVTGTMLGAAVGGAVGATGSSNTISGLNRLSRGWQRGAGIGAAAGAAVGLVTVLVTRGPDTILAKGTSVEMVLDRPLEFSSSDFAAR